MTEFSSPTGLVLGKNKDGQPAIFKRCITIDEYHEPIDEEPFLELLFVFDDNCWVNMRGRSVRWDSVELFIPLAMASSDDFPNAYVDLAFCKPATENACKRCGGSKHLNYFIHGKTGFCPDCNPKEVQE